MNKLSPRQVHLDFHTSPLIGGIGKKFSKENFQKALKLGHLSSITIFAKGHHSQCYYPTKVGSVHPGLDFDLLKLEIDAAHEIGVKAPVYITAGWSAQDAENHPEWHARNKDGSSATTRYDLKAISETAKPNCSWINLCLNDGSYCQHIYELTEEICQRYEKLDGLFYDICFVDSVCYCSECLSGMKLMGINPDDEVEAKKYFVMNHQDFMKKCRDILDKNNIEATLFFNSGGADQYRPMYHFGSTHFELEDLPTAWGGYDKMPPRAKFFANTGKEYLGMTGKFHTEWGEFGGFKTGEALKFETAAMVTYGARCSIGDQMHPDGEMDLETYKNIGIAYEYIEKIEEYCLDGKQTTKLGLYLSDDVDSDEGAEKLLLETQNDFDIVYNNNFDLFDVIVFPDSVKLDVEGKKKLNTFISNGGKVLFTGKSLIEDDFIINIGAKYNGDYGFETDYFCVGNEIANNMVTSPIYCYGNAVKFKNINGKVLSKVLLPYFDRTYGNYCSHRNTPYDKICSDNPGAVQNGNIIYIAHSICKMYKEYGAVYHKRYFSNCLNLLNTNKVLTVEMPSSGRVSLIKQAANNRYCLNLLYASPVKRGHVEIIEDLPVIYDIPVKIAMNELPKRVFEPVGDRELEFKFKNGVLEFVVSKLKCHELIVIEY